MQVLDVFRSPVAISAIVAWLTAQILKLPIEYLRRHEWNWALLASPGGMPSSHSALMSSVAIAIGLTAGFGSPIFALALAIAAIVVYDATGVRHEAGLQAERINMIINEMMKNHTYSGEKVEDLREMIGHSPGEALAGVLYGIAVALLITYLMKPA